MYVATYIFWVFIYYIIKYDIITIPVRDFHHPQPQEQIIRESVDYFLAAIDRSLRIGCYRDTTRRIAFYMNFLRQKTTLTLRDFNSAYFCSISVTSSLVQPNLVCTMHCFPLRVKCVLRFSKRSSFVKQQDGTFGPKPRITNFKSTYY